MKKLCVLILLLLPVVSATAQMNHLANMVEKAVIEYYDTLLTYQKFRLQDFHRGWLIDTNIYLYLDCMEAHSFMGNLQEPDKIPSNVFFRTIDTYIFLKRATPPSPGKWTTVRYPKVNKEREIEVIKISDVDVQADTILIHLTHCYHSKSKEWINGRFLTEFVWAIAGGAHWKYVLSEDRKKWICIDKYFIGI